MPDRILPAIAMRLAATLLLSVMFALAKVVQARGVGLIELLFFRQFVMMLPVAILAALGPGLASLRSNSPWGQVRRAVFGTSGMAMNFAVVTMLPLAEAQTLWFTVPLFMTMLGALWLGEHVGRHRWGAVVAGFIGVLIAFQPSGSALPPLGIALGITSAVTMAITAILVRKIGSIDSSLTTVFWFGGLSSAALFVPMLLTLGSHDAATWGLIVLTGIVGGFGQIALTFSLRFAPVSVVAPIDYASLIWAALFGFVLFGAVPSHWTWVGAPVIIASGLYIVWRERVRGRAGSVTAVD